MSTDQTEDTRNTGVAPLRAAEAHPSDLAGTPAPAYSDVTDNTTIKRLPVIPVPLQRENIKGTVEQAAGLGWHRARYHGLRSPCLPGRVHIRVVRGAAVLTERLWNWWQSIEHHVLLSEAVAAAAPVTSTPCARTPQGGRSARAGARFSVRSSALILIAGLVMARFAPWWGWALCAVAAAAVLARHGRKPGKPLVRPAVVAPRTSRRHRRSSPARSASLGIAGINEAIADRPRAAASSPTCTATAPAGRPSWTCPTA